MGIDGSQDGYATWKQAVPATPAWKRRPFTILLTSVLRTIADALPKKARERFHFPAQLSTANVLAAAPPEEPLEALDLAR